MTGFTGEPPLQPPSARVGQGQPMLYRQGVIIDWNPLTLGNRVQVDGPSGPIFEDLPVLGTAEAATYAPGAIVGIAAVGQSWAIVGRFVTPGTPEASAALDYLGFFARSADTFPTDNITSTSMGDLAHAGPSVTVHIGPSKKALVFLGAQLNSNNEASGAYMSFEVTGASAIAANFGNSVEVSLSGTNAGVIAEINATRMVFLDEVGGLEPGTNVFTAKYARGSNTVGASAQASQRNITVVPL